MSSILLHHHLGLGDHFVCNGLVHKVSENYDKVYLPCKSHNYETVKYLYSESPKIQVFKIDNIEHQEVLTFSKMLNIPILRVGFEKCNPLNWDRSFYNQLGIDFSERYDSFYLPKNKPSKVIDLPKEDFILIHNRGSVGIVYDFKIKTNLKIIEIVPNISNNLFSFLELIKNAKEIHCIHSSVFHLVDSIFHNFEITDKMYYYDIRHDHSTQGTYFKVSDIWKKVEFN